jgi:anti-anti-sigma factor
MVLTLAALRFSPPVLTCGDRPAVAYTPERPWIDVTLRVREDETIIRIKGEASFGQARILEGRLLILCAHRPKHVTLDLSGVTFISARCIGVLAQFRRHVVRMGGRVRLAPKLPPLVRELLDAVRLTKLFDSDMP